MDLRMKGSDEATFQGFIPSVRNGSPLPTQTGQSVEKYLSNLTATKSAQQLTILPSNTLSSRKKTLFGEKVNLHFYVFFISIFNLKLEKFGIWY